jgi:MarR family transcriptional regulator, organic hydroperoxide resistance regulator
MADQGERDEFEILKLDNQMCFPLYAASRLVVQAYRPLLEELGITYPQYLVLMVLWEKDGSSVSEIGARLSLDSGTLTPVLKRLAAQGLVKRRRSKHDDRAVENWLSERGRALKLAAVEIPTKLLHSTAISLEEVMKLKNALKPILEKLGEYHCKDE